MWSVCGSGSKRLPSDLDDGVTILRYHSITRHEPHRFKKSLSNDDAVEWVMMVVGEVFNGGRMFCFYIKQAIPRFTKVLCGFVRRYGHYTSPQRVLYGDLPNTGGTDPYRCFWGLDKLS